MIFVTVGSQSHFDRLVQGMDAWAATKSDEVVFAQICDSTLIPEHMDFTSFLTAEAFRDKCTQADLIVSHAGIGNILLALELQKPIVVMPRRAHLQETRNDHQLATVNLLKEKIGIVVAAESSDLDKAISTARASTSKSSISAFASQELIGAIKDFINMS